MTYSFRYTPLNNLNVTLGGAYNIYQGDHFGEVIWAQYASNGSLGDRYYDNDATKKDFNSYLKADYRIQRFSLFADVQYRNVDYSYQGINRDLSFLQQQVNLNFFNPKVGFSVNFDNNSLAYASVAVANKEPIRRDYTDSSPDSQPRPERLTDFEAGYKINGTNYSVGINGYAMLYKDQLVTTGFINDVGSAVRLN
jgi:iron complex outermembrane receptor protein